MKPEEIELIQREVKKLVSRAAAQRRQAALVHAVVAQSTAAVQPWASHDFDLMGGSSFPLTPTGITRSAVNLCGQEIPSGSVVTLHWYTADDSGGFWGATHCGGGEGGISPVVCIGCRDARAASIYNVNVSGVAAYSGATSAPLSDRQGLAAQLNQIHELDYGGVENCSWNKDWQWTGTRDYQINMWMNIQTDVSEFGILVTYAEQPFDYGSRAFWEQDHTGTQPDCENDMTFAYDREDQGGTAVQPLVEFTSVGSVIVEYPA